MSNIWNFSPSSEALLQRCIEAAALQNTENQWTQKFGRKTLISNSKPEVDAVALIIEEPPSPEEQQKNEVSISYDDFFDSLHQEVRFDHVINECCKNPNLYKIMAENLPVNIVEKLFNLTFTTEDVDNSFLRGLFLKFLPKYIKVNYSSTCIDIFTKTNEKYPEIFLEFIQTLLEDIEIPSQVLNNLVTTLDDKKVTLFVEKLTKFELTSERFLHNILTINSAYKSCKKSENIQNWICTNLLTHSKSCKTDKNYGKLFLAYLQSEKMLEHKVSKKLEECLEEHQSPFKRPCAVLLKELVYNT